jgi:hypothetical protein
MQAPSRVETFMQWLRCILFELLLTCTHLDEGSEEVWRAATGAFVHAVSERGVVATTALAGLSSVAVRAMLDAARRHSWCAADQTQWHVKVRVGAACMQATCSRCVTRGCARMIQRHNTQA